MPSKPAEAESQVGEGAVGHLPGNSPVFVDAINVAVADGSVPRNHLATLSSSPISGVSTNTLSRLWGNWSCSSRRSRRHPINPGAGVEVEDLMGREGIPQPKAAMVGRSAGSLHLR